MDVSIIIPTHNPDEILDLSIDRLKKQKFDGKIQLIKVQKDLGLAESLNLGIQQARYEIIVSLHQDCVPEGEEWLSKLIEPFKDPGIVASVSEVELPLDLWNKFSIASKLLTAKELKIKPLMDDKGCAYRKEALVKAGLFDFNTFRTCGEDFDMYFKLKRQGKIAHPACKILHFHKTNFEARLKKEAQYAEGYGTLFRIYKAKMPRWFLAILKTIPILGILIFLFSIKKKVIKYFWLWPFLSIILNFIYSYGFWAGFLRRKQRI